MPNQQILNFMNQGAPPSLTDRAAATDLSLAQSAAGVGNTLGQMEMNRMKMDAMRQKQSVLDNFQGEERAKQMMGVDPAEGRAMQKHIADMDENQRKIMERRLGVVVNKALDDDTPAKWKQSKWKMPFSERGKIIALKASFTEMLSYKRPPKGKDSGADAGSGLKAADENAIYKYVAGQFDATYNPLTGEFSGFKNDQSKKQVREIAAAAARMLANNPGLTRLEAFNQSYKAYEKASQTSGGKYNYVPGKGLVPK